MKRAFLTFSLCFLLAACGFKPMHGTAFDTGAVAAQAQLAHVEINNIPDRSGQFLRNALIDRFYIEHRPANAWYELTIAPVEEVITDLDITKSSDATRSQLRLTTNMTLVEKESGEKILVRTIRSSSSFNVLDSEFATRVSERNTRENALNDLARQIELQISLYFQK